MIISREQDYAIRLLRALSDGKKHSIGAMCESEQIPTPFGRKIVEKLAKSHIVRCERGKYGGCYLDCDLHQLSLYDFLTSMEEGCYLNACLVPGATCTWQENHSEPCQVHKNLAGLQRKLQKALAGLDLYSVIFDPME